MIDGAGDRNGRQHADASLISEIITAIVSYVPAMIVDPDSPNFALIRTMFGLILIAIIVYVIAMTPFRTVIARSMDKLSSLFTRNEQR